MKMAWQSIFHPGEGLTPIKKEDKNGNDRVSSHSP